MGTTQHEGTATLAAFAKQHGLTITRRGYVEIVIDGDLGVVGWNAAPWGGFVYGVRWRGDTIFTWHATPEEAARAMGWRPAGEAPDVPELVEVPTANALTETYRDGCRDLLAQLEAMQAERDAARRERDDALARLDDANRRLRAVHEALEDANEATR